jgi:DNA-binding transcriptional ArsR family regulator
METKAAVEALSSLAHDTRLGIFRLLVIQGEEGFPAKTISERLGVVPATLSFHLSNLERAGLLKSWRVQRQVFYAADYAGMSRLLSFLAEDCCQGRPEICLPGCFQAASGTA